MEYTYYVPFTGLQLVAGEYKTVTSYEIIESDKDLSYKAHLQKELPDIIKVLEEKHTCIGATPLSFQPLK
jgi:hypothetical protein